MSFEVASNIVNIEAEEMAEAVRLENSTGQICSHHLINAALQQSTWNIEIQQIKYSKCPKSERSDFGRLTYRSIFIQ